MPKTLVRTIYFNNPERSDDIAILNEPAFDIRPKKSVLVEDEDVSPLEYGSREYFSKGYTLSNSRANAMESYLYGDVIVGYQDGSIYQIMSRKESVGSDLKVRQIAQGKSPILALRVSPDKRYLAVSQFSVVTIIDLTDNELVAQLHRVKGRILNLAWSPDSQVLLMGRANGDVYSWGLEEDIRFTLDSLNVIQLYETQASPVVGLEFHPSGRAFFTALENGSLFLVRLVQTEIDLGIREEGKEYEVDKGTYVQRFGGVEGNISKLILLPETDELIVVSLTGSAYKWRIRGLKELDKVDVGSEASTYAEYIGSNVFSSNKDLIASIGRGLRLKLSCLNKDYSKLIKPTSEVIVSEKNVPQVDGQSRYSSASDYDDSDLIRELNQEILKNENSQPRSDVGAGPDLNLVLETAKYLESISIINLNAESGVLWVGGKSGTISAFYVKDYLESSSNSRRIENICK